MFLNTANCLSKQMATAAMVTNTASSITIYFTGVDESTAAGVIPSATCDIGKKNIACERIVNHGEYYLRAIAPSNEIGITESTTEKNFTVTFKLASNTYAELYKYLQKGGSFMIEARVSKIYK